MTATEGMGPLQKVGVRMGLEPSTDPNADARTTLGITVVRVLAELWRIASADPAGIYREDGTVLPVPEMPEDIRRAISGIEVNELWGTDAAGNRIQIGVTKKVKFWSKEKTLELLMKNMAMLVERHKLELPDDLAAALQAAREREARMRSGATPAVPVTPKPAALPAAPTPPGEL